MLTSDWHLQNRAWAERRDLRGDAYYSAEQIVDYAIDRSLPILAAGDLIDRKANPAEVVQVLTRLLGRCEHAGVDVFYIQGQHDMQTPPWFQAVNTATVWAHQRAGGLPPGQTKSLYGLDFTNPSEMQAALDGIPSGIDILMLHQRCEEFMGVGETDLSLTQIPHARLAVIGDYHKSKVVNVTGASGQQLTVVSPGSTCMQAADEPTTKGFYVLREDMTVEFRELWTRPAKVYPPIYLAGLLEEFEQTLNKDLEHWQAYAEDLPEHIRKPIVVVKYAYDVTGAYDKICKIIGDRAYMFINTIPSKVEEQAQAKERKNYEQVASGGLIGALQARIKNRESRVYKDLEKLLQSENPADELHKIRKEFLREAETAQAE